MVIYGQLKMPRLVFNVMSLIRLCRKYKYLFGATDGEAYKIQQPIENSVVETFNR